MRRTPIVIALAALVPAGCGSSKTVVTVTRPLPATSTGSGTANAPTGATSTAATTATSTAASSSTSTGTTPPAHHSSPPTLQVTTFRSPSGNIGCVIAVGTARCDIRQRRWSPPPRPPGCPTIVGFGQGLIVERTGVGHFVCAGDTALNPSAKPLAYGSDTASEGFRCASRFNGMTCTDQSDGHGFFIAIQGYRSF